jgi:hypothetical protein
MKIIVSLTSWPQRIDTAIYTIKSILAGTVLPAKIVLNLCEEEFKGIELPEFVNNTERLEINWVKGPNTKAFKKLLPTIEKYPDDIIITVDDDISYPPYFVEKMLDTYFEDPSRPVTVHHYIYNNVLIPWGGGTLYKKEFLIGYEEMLTNDIIETNEDDWFYAFVLLRNGIKYRVAGKGIYYNPYIYIQTTSENQMYNKNMYDRNKTIEALSKQLEACGDSFAILANKLYQKYKNS